MYSLLILSMTLCLSLSAPFSSFDLKRPEEDTGADDKLIPESTGKLLTIFKKNLKPKEETTLLVSEEMVFSSTGYPTFDAFDQNSDGFIEFEEFAATDGKDHKSNFQRADTNGDLKLSPEEFSQLSVVVYEPEQFSDSDSDEPPVVFLTPPESITRFIEKDTKPESDSTFDDYKDVPLFDSTTKEETKDDKDVTEEKDTKKEDNNNEDNKQKIKSEIEKPEKKSDITSERSDAKEVKDKSKEGSHFTAEDMPVKIDDEDDEEMIDVKDEDVPMEVMDDLSDDNHYDLEEVREPQEDDKQMNDQLNSIE